MSKPCVFVADALDPSALEHFEQRGWNAVMETGLSEEQLVERVAQANALVVRSATKVTRTILEAGSQLSVVGRAGVGVDNVDCTTATERGIVVMNAPDGNTITTAELALAMLMSLARHVPSADRRTRAGTWSKKGLMGTEVTGKTLGIIGLGRIGRALAQRALGLSMQVVAYDPYLDHKSKSPVPGSELVELQTLLERSDFISLHVPLTDQTRNILGREQIAQMKSGACIINAARGGLVDEQALLTALEESRLGGAALDVLTEEPPSKGHPLLERDDVIVTPHLGASSREAQAQVAVDIARQICDFHENGLPRNAVNAPAAPVERLSELAPYLQLAEAMGKFLAQSTPEPLGKLELRLLGGIAEADAGHVRLALLAGALNGIVEGGVNFVNAPHLAKERGLSVLESKEEQSGPWTSLIRVSAFTRDGQATHVIAGTVFGQKPRILRIDDLHIDLAPVGELLITRHVDEPGVVGRIGTVLGEMGVNIRRIELGPPTARKSESPKTEVNTEDSEALASGFFSLCGSRSDQWSNSALVETIERLASVREARLVHLS